jgi:hypothetical protein
VEKLGESSRDDEIFINNHFAYTFLLPFPYYLLLQHNPTIRRGTNYRRRRSEEYTGGGGEGGGERDV